MPDCAATPILMREENDLIRSRRRFLKTVLAIALPGCATAGSVETVRKVRAVPIRRTDVTSGSRVGADLNVLSWHRGTWQDHKVGGGLDLFIKSDPRIYPVAAGIVTSVGTHYRSGNYIVIWHGLYFSEYVHLSEMRVPQGMHVRRSDLLGIGGATGSGAAESGPHLHLGFMVVADIAELLEAKYRVYVSRNGTRMAALDPADFAAITAKDRHGLESLPYWESEAENGPLDASWEAHYRPHSGLIDSAIDRFEISQVKDVIYRNRTPFTSMNNININVGEKTRFLWNALRTQNHPFSNEEAARLSTSIQTFLESAPALTAPLRNPSPRKSHLSR